ncbi:dynein assembly factor with WD repeat domains 1-like [Clytia hemisphaerica]
MDLDDAGSNLIVTGNQEYSGVAKVLDVSDLKIFKEKMLLEGFSKRMHACAINRAGDLGCVSGYFNGFMAFDLTNGTIKYYVQHAYRIIGGFFSNNCLLCIDDNYNFFKYDPESEKDVCEYKGHTHLCRDATFLNEERQVMTVSIDGTLRIFDTETGENIYGFFNHRAQRYTCLAAHPSEKIFLAASENSMVYVLKTTPDFV